MTYRQILECDRCKKVISNQEIHLHWNLDIEKEDIVWEGTVHVCATCCTVLMTSCMKDMEDNKQVQTENFLRRHGINPEEL